MFFKRVVSFILTLCAVVCTSVAAASITRTDDSMVVDPENIEKLTTPAPSLRLYDNWTDWETWDYSADVAQAFPRYRSGYDLDGVMVHVLEIGALDQRKFSAEKKDKLEEFWKAYEWWTRCEEKDATLNNNEGVVFIVDFDQYTLASSASRDALEFDLKLFSILFRQTNVIKYGFLVNVNFAAESFLNLAKPFIGDFLSRLEICGTRRDEWKPKLLKKIAASQLPPKYGGSEDWKPLGLNEDRETGMVHVTC